MSLNLSYVPLFTPTDSRNAAPHSASSFGASLSPSVG